MNQPDKVPDAVIQSIADYALQYQEQGECPEHDHRWQGRYVSPWENTLGTSPDVPATLPCTCVVKMERFERFLKDLHWSYDHYSFNFAGMYVGVELDGHMHT